MRSNDVVLVTLTPEPEWTLILALQQRWRDLRLLVE